MMAAITITSLTLSTWMILCSNLIKNLRVSMTRSMLSAIRCIWTSTIRRQKTCLTLEIFLMLVIDDSVIKHRLKVCSLNIDFTNFRMIFSVVSTLKEWNRRFIITRPTARTANLARPLPKLLAMSSQRSNNVRDFHLLNSYIY